MSDSASREPRLMRHRALGIEAVYRIIATHGDLVEVEVVDVPGLAPGQRLRLSERAVAAMTDVADSAPSRNPARSRERSGRLRVRPLGD